LIEGNGESAKGRSPSEENWRFKEKPDISPDSKLLEKTLEKTIARRCGDDWVNQVPTASGLVGSGERQRNLDLVHRLSETQYDLIELKVGSDTPLYAATPQAADFSVAKLGGSDSLSIRPGQRRNFRDPYREFEFLIGHVRRLVFAPDSPKSTASSNSTCSAI
jgi:hypothetical protein